MPYEMLATARTPALVIYLIDVSVSMQKILVSNKTRLEVVKELIETMLQQMIFRSTKGTIVAPRYHIAMYAYSQTVWDLLDGVRTIAEIADYGQPPLQSIEDQRTTDTSRAFHKVEQLLVRELPLRQGNPAPLICHMTDGELTGSEPEAAVRRIMNMVTADGKVLVENVYISERPLPAPIGNVRDWSGIQPSTPVTDPVFARLRALSSPLPASYRRTMLDAGYKLAPDALMLLPGMTPELVEMGLAMSGATPVAR